MQLVISLYTWYVKGHWHWLSSSLSENALPGQSYLEGLQLITQYIHELNFFRPFKMFEINMFMLSNPPVPQI